MPGLNKEMKTAGIIGYGKIGKTLHAKLLEDGWVVDFVVSSKHIFNRAGVSIDRTDNWRDHLHFVNVVFLAIPTLDDGKIALDYINAIVERGITVVTCEKGALSNYFDELKSVLDCIGYSATVGGGSGIIHFLNRRFFSGICEVHAILNGTLNYIWDDLRIGNPLGHIIEEVKMLGYAEPGEKDSVKIILGEIGYDATKKASILFNLCFNSGIILRAKDISLVITEEMIKRAIAEAMNRRFVVSFERIESFNPDINDIVAFTHQIDGWVIIGAFKKIDTNPVIFRLCNSATWVNNAVLTLEGENGSSGIYLCIGPGAGASPVATAMIRDAEKLLL